MIRKHSWSAMALGVLALGAWGCSDGAPTDPTVTPATDAGPHFLSWAPQARPQFAFEGMDKVGSAISASVTQLPPAVDQSSSASGYTSSLSWSHTAGTGANRLLVVGVSIRNGYTQVTGVTYKGVALTKLQARNNSDVAVRVEQWYLVAPTSGTGTVTVNLSGNAKVVGGALSFTGVNQVSPFQAQATDYSTGSGWDDASVDISGTASELVMSTVATEGDGGVWLAPVAGQSQAWKRYTGGYSLDVAGGASTALGTSSLTMGWVDYTSAKWAIAAVAIKPVPVVALSQYQATFWAKRGVSRSVQINYSAGGGTSPFMKLTVSDPTYVPGRGNIAVGDSVLITATVDPNSLTVSLEPHATQFGTPSQLKIWYSGAGGDLNGDGVVDSDDSYIENQLLGMWYRPDASSSWTTISATQSLTEKSFMSQLPHFSQYAVAW